jgi:hypothetical protein
MIINSGSLLSPRVYLEIGNVEVNYFSVAQIELDLCVNQHDTLTILMNGIPSKAITDYVNAPVRFSINSGPGRTHEFVGYILYVEPEYSSSAPIVNQTMFYSAKIVCFGASVSMKSTRSRVWGATTIYKIAQEIAARYRFSLSVIRDEFVIRNAVQANESDWEFLVRLCETYGYSMTVHGTHMRIWDPFKAIGRRASFERLVPQNEYAGPTPGAILNLKGTFGYLTPDGESYKYRVSSIDDNGSITIVSDPESGPVPSWSGYGETPQYISTLVDSAMSIGEGQKLIEAERKKNFAFNAHVQISAGAGIIPGGIVSVEGYEANFEGLWYVRDVKHSMGGSSYSTELLISRDYNTSGEFLVPPTTLEDLAPEASYVDNGWVASKQTVELYV